MIYIKKFFLHCVKLLEDNVKIIELPKVTVEKRKKIRHTNLQKNRHAYAQLKNQLVPKEMKLHQFRKWYHPTLSTQEKDILLELGIDPWSYTTFTLSDEHKARLASAEGLDFYVVYDHTDQNLKLYIVTDGCVELLHTLKTYYGNMSNFYKFVYTASGTVSVKTDVYTTSSSFDAKSDLLNF